MTGTWRSLRATSRFAGLDLVGPITTTTYARAAAPVAPPKPRPKKPAPKPAKNVRVRAGLADGFGLTDGSHGLSGGQLGQRAVGPVRVRDLRRELESLRGKPGTIAARRRAWLKRKIAELAAR